MDSAMHYDVLPQGAAAAGANAFSPPASFSLASATAESNAQSSSEHSTGQSAFTSTTDTGPFPSSEMNEFVPRSYPHIFAATYSAVPVFEMEVNGVSVMRRQSDLWMNATQILKVAGVPKPHRTKILEKEMATEPFEKVQGGHGKYQGTWMSFDRCLALCREYNVEEILRPILEYDRSLSGEFDGPVNAGDFSAVQARQLPQSGAPDGTSRKRNIDEMTMGQMTKEPLALGDFITTGTADGSSFHVVEDPMGLDKQNGIITGVDGLQNAASMAQLISQETDKQQQASTQQGQGQGRDQGQIQSQEDRDTAIQQFETTNDQTAPLHKRSRTSHSLFDSFNGRHLTEADGRLQGLQPLPFPLSPEQGQKMRLILTLFLDKRRKDFSTHPAILTLSAGDLELPLDEWHNNALHWAAMLARIPLFNALMIKGLNINRTNLAGETALQKAVGTRNNLDYRSFPKLLRTLAPTIPIVDSHGRTILHHIALMGASDGGGHVAAKHYLETLLDFVVHNDNNTSSSSSASASASDPPVRTSTQDTAVSEVDPSLNGGPSRGTEVISLDRFMSEFVNLQDDQGDTALNLAGRARTVLVPQLLELGASPHIPNHSGLKPADYGVGVDMAQEGTSVSTENPGEKHDPEKSAAQVRDEAIAQISTVVKGTIDGLVKEMTDISKAKRDETSRIHAKIRESARARQIEQKQLDELKGEAREEADVARRIKNLEKASSELAARRDSLLADGRLKDTSSTAASTVTETATVASISRFGDAERCFGLLDISKWNELFPAATTTETPTEDPAPSFTPEQTEFLTSLLPRQQQFKNHVDSLSENNTKLAELIAQLKSMDEDLGKNYQRMVIACTGWPASMVDEAAEGLMECVKDLNANPVPDDMAIEILMKERGQHW